MQLVYRTKKSTNDNLNTKCQALWSKSEQYAEKRLKMNKYGNT